MASTPTYRAVHTWRSQLIRLITRHALLAFFVLAYALSWTVWLIELRVAQRDPLVGAWVGLLAPYGPALAALALSALLQPQRLQRDHSGWRFMLAGATLAGTAGLQWHGLAEIARSAYPLVAAALWLLITGIPVWIVWSVRSPIQGVRALLSSLTTWRVHPAWYGVALLIMPFATLLGMGLLVVLGQPIPAFPRSEPLSDLLPLLLTVFLATLLYGGPLGEELGWRGFAVRRLQTRWSPLMTSLILGLLWGLWHLPLHLSGVYHGVFPDGAAGMGLRLISSVGLAILFTWLYNRTDGNLLVMVLLHTAVNNSAGFWLPITLGTSIMTAVFVVIVIRADKMWLPLPAVPTSLPGDTPSVAAARGTSHVP